MKRTINLLALAAVVAVFAVPAFAQADQCTDDNKDLWYQKTFLPNFKGEPPQQKLAYDAAKKYLAACPEDDYSKYMKRVLVDPMDAMLSKAGVGKQFEDAAKNKNYAEVLRIGKLVLADNPDNTLVYIIMGQAGLGDSSLLSDAAPYAKKSIELIEGGKPFAPYPSKDQALASMTYAIAKSMVKTDPTGAIPYFIKAAKYDSDLKKAALLYNELAAAYGAGPVSKYSDEYKPFIGQPESTESKLVLANLNQAVDRQIDALARAAAYSTNPTDKKAMMDALGDVAKPRNMTEADLNAMVASVINKPLPDLPQPITSLPSTPTTTTGGTPGTQPATNGGAKPAGTTTPTTTTGTQQGKTGPAKPTATPTPKPRRLNHRRG
jgi:hypothetical protein